MLFDFALKKISPPPPPPLSLGGVCRSLPSSFASGLWWFFPVSFIHPSKATETNKGK